MKAVLQLTDLHIFEDSDRTMLPIDTKHSFQRVLEKALTDSAQWDLLVLSGDLADLGEDASYAWLSNQLASIDIPILVLPGNHDDRALMENYFGHVSSYELGAWRITLLDSCIPPSTQGQLSNSQIEILAATLDAHPEQPHLVFLHHPPIALGSSWMDSMGLTNSELLWECLSETMAKVTLVAGHAHQNFDAFYRGVRVLVSPSTCTQFVPRTTQFALDARAAGYRRIELHDNGDLMTKVVRL